MSRLELRSPNQAQLVVEGLYKDLERRIESSPPGLCPVDMSRAFLEICHAQSCGKCVPCRVGLGQLKNLITDVLDGKATIRTLTEIQETAKSIMESADCAIGYEAANMVYKGAIGFKDDYVEHIMYHRCLSTLKQPVPCVSRCPARVDIPGYIALVREGRYEDAIRLIRKDNPFPTTCGFICEHPCEALCRRNMIDDAVNIRGLKRMAADAAGYVAPPECAESTGKNIAVVGGGPGGLSAAYFLQLMGHQVTVYEMLPKLGGMLRYGIPNYRLPKERLDDDIQAILDTGVKVDCGKAIGKDYSIVDLKEKYDAVLITIGASTDKKLGLEGEDAKGVISAVQFLRNVGYGTQESLEGKEVAVIGGGNVSMDAVRTSVRLGAKKVSIVYRRRVADMTALPDEISGAEAEGVESQTLIVAIGQDIEYQHFEEAGVPVQRGKINVEKFGGFEEMPGVFAGGDCATGPSTVISAIAAGKVIAANIDEYLGYHHEITADVEIPEPKLEDKPACGRVNLTEREAGERVKDFEGVENCMTEKEACQEAGRCLRCDHFGYGIFKGGRDTKW